MVGTPPVGDLRGRLPKSLVWFIVAAIALISLGELDRLLSAVVDGKGTSRSLAAVVGWTGSDDADAWQVWASNRDTAGLARGLVFAHIGADALLVIAYSVLAWRALKASRAGRIWLSLLVLAEAVEAALLFCMALRLSGGIETGPDVEPSLLARSVPRVALIKWGLGGAVVATALYVRRQGLRSNLWAALRAMFYQRITYTALVLLASLALVPAAGLPDQMPDVLRSWHAPLGHPGQRFAWVAAAVLAMVLLTVCLFVVGRIRSEQVWRTFEEQIKRPMSAATSWWWLAPTMPVGALAIVGWVSHESAWRIDKGTMALFVGIPLMLAVISWVLYLPYLWRFAARWTLAFWRRVVRRRRVRVSGRSRWRALIHHQVWSRCAIRDLWRATPPACPDPCRVDQVWRAGDLGAVLVLVVVGLALVRAYVAPVALGPNESEGAWWSGAGLLVAGACLALASVPVARALLYRLDSTALSNGVGWSARRLLRPDLHGGAPRRRRDRALLNAIVWSGSGSVLTMFAVLPLDATESLGVFAAVLAVLAAWAAAVGLWLAQLQRVQPLEVFRLVRLRSAPALVVVLLLPLLVTIGESRHLHAVRAGSDASDLFDDERMTLRVEFERWLDRSEGCVIDLEGDVDAIRPMVIVAASGGGIKAAVWTSRAMQELNSVGACSRSVFLSSGVSGGSVGLALSRISDATIEDREGGDPVTAVEQLAKPRALGGAAVGLLVGDLLGGVTGIRVFSRWDDEWAWRDRAALMEESWERTTSALADQWSPHVTGPGGALVLNSAASNGCRVLISQIDLSLAEVAASPGDPSVCRNPATTVAGSLDLIDQYQDCLGSPSWATMAMLSSRFPFVTPGGITPPEAQSGQRVGDCATGREFDEDENELQLIDGGYAEGSGLGTLVDLAPRLMRQVRHHNASDSGRAAPVVPVVLFLENHVRTDVVGDAPDLIAEILVPTQSKGPTRTVQTTETTLLQRLTRATSAGAACPPPPNESTPGDEPAGTARASCVDAVKGVRDHLQGSRVVYVAPRTEPSVEAPLGWTLSNDSLDRLGQAMTDQADNCGKSAKVLKYPCFGALLDLLRKS